MRTGRRTKRGRERKKRVVFFTNMMYNKNQETDEYYDDFASLLDYPKSKLCIKVLAQVGSAKPQYIPRIKKVATEPIKKLSLLLRLGLRGEVYGGQRNYRAVLEP